MKASIESDLVKAIKTIESSISGLSDGQGFLLNRIRRLEDEVSELKRKARNK